MFTVEPDGTPRFHPLARLSDPEVADALAVIRRRVLRFLVRRGVIEMDDEALTVVGDATAERDPTLAQLASAAASGLPPAGPEARHRPVVALPPAGRVRTRALCADMAGFGLHAATRAGAYDVRAREALVKYILRPPVANEHLTLRPEGLVRIALKRPFRDGTVAVDMDPLSLLCRLAAAVPPPRQHTVRYAGVLAPAATLRPKVIPPPPDDPPEDDLEPAPAPLPNVGHRCRYRPWAELLRRTFGVDVEVCPGCSSRMKLLALVRDPEGIARFLTALGLPTTAPPLAPARAPPYWQSRVLRRKAGQDRQHSLDLTT